MPVSVIPTTPATFSNTMRGVDVAREYYYAFVTLDLTGIPAGSTLNSYLFECSGDCNYVAHVGSSPVGNILNTGTGIPQLTFTPVATLTASAECIPNHITNLASGSFSFTLDHSHLPDTGLMGGGLRNAFGTITDLTVWIDGGFYDAIDCHWTLARFTIDWTPPPVVIATPPLHLSTQNDNGNVQMLFVPVRYPTGYVVGLDVTTVSPPPAGRVIDIVQPLDGNKAVLTGNILRLYNSSGVELSAGTGTQGVHLCRIIS